MLSINSIASEVHHELAIWRFNDIGGNPITPKIDAQIFDDVLWEQWQEGFIFFIENKDSILRKIEQEQIKLNKESEINFDLKDLKDLEKIKIVF
jgi:hypothetical protein